jgi:hypothetical protein
MLLAPTLLYTCPGARLVRVATTPSVRDAGLQETDSDAVGSAAHGAGAHSHSIVAGGLLLMS